MFFALQTDEYSSTDPLYNNFNWMGSIIGSDRTIDCNNDALSTSDTGFHYLQTDASITITAVPEVDANLNFDGVEFTILDTRRRRLAVEVEAERPCQLGVLCEDLKLFKQESSYPNQFLVESWFKCDYLYPVLPAEISVTIGASGEKQVDLTLAEVFSTLNSCSGGIKEVQMLFFKDGNSLVAENGPNNESQLAYDIQNSMNYPLSSDRGFIQFKIKQYTDSYAGTSIQMKLFIIDKWQTVESSEISINLI